MRNRGLLEEEKILTLGLLTFLSLFTFKKKKKKLGGMELVEHWGLKEQHKQPCWYGRERVGLCGEGVTLGLRFSFGVVPGGVV